MRRAGVKKRFLTINKNDDDEDERITFCYCERGSKDSHKPTLVFIHGFSSDKHTWLTVIKNIPHSFHCIAVDMPGHGETTGFSEEQVTADNLVDNLKLFLDELNLNESICLVGTSMGGSVVAMFAAKYPSYVKMICVLAPVPPGEEYETEMIQQIRSGTYNVLLPETHEQFYATADAMTTKKLYLRRLLANGYFKTRLPTLDHHKKILQLAFENDYPNLEQSYSQLKDFTCPSLIIWGRKDQLCAVEGAYYFSNLIPKSEVILFDDCGHLITNDKPKETAKSIVQFLKENHSSEEDSKTDTNS
ncbi:unnamed protein product [Adineta steineri]|uniref:acylglycerol lipase n=1 Tax=Adineta steineri TaxID=433720 RepID=A0A814KIU5_9BILA|nr:unnamed protein product [Adineta steineri]CAF1013021.1 unnamed protein product [Adineta steineri]CAF1051638.1 unnamed protein product [Adineta steineri]